MLAHSRALRALDACVLYVYFSKCKRKSSVSQILCKFIDICHFTSKKEIKMQQSNGHKSPITLVRILNKTLLLLLLLLLLFIYFKLTM